MTANAATTGMAPGQSNGEEEWLLRVIDLKQYDYCPRIVYYEYCLPGIRPTTYKMQAGIEAQDKMAELEKRRTLREYGVQDGERHFNVLLTSRRLGCTGLVDLVVDTGTGAARRLIPIDFKLSRREPGSHFRLQLACYALMLEEAWEAPAPEGVIYLIPTREAIQVTITTKLRNTAQRMVATIRALIKAEIMPDPTPQRSRCVDCEFRRFCNDVL